MKGVPATGGPAALWDISSAEALVTYEMLALSFVLCALIGLERQFRQKSAGLRTHTLVGTGSAVFTLVSAYGFGYVDQTDVLLDPSRIAAQIVSGIGFLGAGVIFVKKDSVRGLTTAATIWVAAAVGMACGAGLPVLAIVATLLNLIAQFALTRLGGLFPQSDNDRAFAELLYVRGSGALFGVLRVATERGVEASVVSVREPIDLEPRAGALVILSIKGEAARARLLECFADVPGVLTVRLLEERGD